MLYLAFAVDVSLYDNLFTGTIPTEFGLLQKLESYALMSTTSLVQSHQSWAP